MAAETAQPESERPFDGLLHRQIDVEFRALNEEERSFEVVASTEALDSHGDVLKQYWDLSRYEKNGVVLWNHNTSGGYFGGEAEDTLPIGRGSARVAGKQLLATLYLLKGDPESEPLVDKIWRRIQQGVLRAVSVGFRPGQITAVTNEAGEIQHYELGSKERPNELREISIVPMGSNPEAVAKAIAWERKHLKVDATVIATANVVTESESELPAPAEPTPETESPAPAEPTPTEEPTPAPAAAEQQAPTAGKEVNMAENKADETKAVPTQFVQAITIALGLPVGSTENDILARATATRDFEKACVSLAASPTTAEALGALRGLVDEAGRAKALDTELTKIRGERDRQNFDNLIAAGKADRKLDKAWADKYEAEFNEAAPEARAAVVERLRGHLPLMRAAAFPSPARQVSTVSTSATGEHVWNGKTYAQMSPSERDAFKRAEPEVAKQVRAEWIASGSNNAWANA